MRVWDMPLEERLQFFKEDFYAPMVVRTVNRLFGNKCSGVFAQDVWRTPNHKYMVYSLPGLDWDEVDAVGREIFPNYTLTDADEDRFPIALVPLGEPNPKGHLDITHLFDKEL